MIHKLRISLIIALFTLPLVFTNGYADEGEKEKKSGPAVFATVGDDVILMSDYRFAFIRAAREKFYHGTPVQSLVDELQRKVGKQLVEDVLLVKEAKRRGIKPDASFVEKQIQALDDKNKGNQEWIKNREKVLPRFITFFEERDLIRSLEKLVIDEMPDPTKKEIRAFYKENSELFTEPEKLRVWVLTLKIDPGAVSLVWDETKQKAIEIISRLKRGEDFESLAKKYSQDYTAARGGDMGFIHRGVLAGKAQAEADRLGPGEFSLEPVLLLEGYVIIKRGGVILPKFHTFDEVEIRAGKLAKRELKKSTWENLKIKLGKGVPVEINEKIYRPLGDHAETHKVEDGKKK